MYNSHTVHVGRVKDKKLNKYVSCLDIVDDFELFCRVFVCTQNGPHTQWLLLHFSQHQVSFIVYALQT